MDLTIDAGQLVLIVGPSGGGKSTLAYCIKGIIPHQVESSVQGLIEVAGFNVLQHTPAELASKVGMVFQDPEAQLCNLYIEDEVAFGPENLRLDPAEVMARVETALSLAGLNNAELRNKFVYEISGGQKQRLAVASVLAMQPDVLIFDEPTANLDPQGAREVFEAIKHLRRRGFTILVIEHKIEELIDVADRMIVVSDGRVVADGPPRQLLQQQGQTLKEAHGLWVPEICDIAIQLASDYPWDPFPLTANEIALQIKDRLLEVPAQAAPPAASLGENHLAGAGPEEFVHVSGLRYKYPDGTAALRDVNVSLHPGETVGIAGTNGSGKTTLAKTLVGLLRPSAGTVVVCGMNVAKTSTHTITEKVGYVFQYPEHQFLKERVYDEVAYSLDVHGYSADDIRERTRAILGLFGLSDKLERHPLALSGGQKRRLSVATALVLSPELLILDEPTFGQDQDNTRKMMEYLLEQITKRRHMTTVMITHDMELLAEYCDRVLVMSGGQVVFNGPPRMLFALSDILALGSLKKPMVCELVSQLQAEGYQVPDLITVREFVDWHQRHVPTLRRQPAAPESLP
jgi:energy-coupling factor transport system ATP-binding protein